MKFLYFLNREKRFLSLREVSDLVKSVEGDAADVDGDLTTRLSNAISIFKRDRKLVKVQIGSQNRNTFWGKPDWMDDNGKEAKAEFAPNLKYVSEGKEDIDLDSALSEIGMKL